MSLKGLCSLHFPSANHWAGWKLLCQTGQQMVVLAGWNENSLLMLGFYVDLCMLPCKLGVLHFLPWSGQFLRCACC